MAYFAVCQGAWFVSVHGGANANALPGILCAVVVVSWHLLRAARPLREARVVIVVTLGGWTWDSLLAATGMLVYPGRPANFTVAPLWIAALWALFSVQLNVVLIWLRERLWLAAVLGAVGGPLSFRAGAALGAVYFPHPVAAFCALAIGWAVILPTSLWVAKRWDGVTRPARELEGGH